MNNIEYLIATIEDLKNQLKSAQKSLELVREKCEHSWGPTKYISVHHDGYILSGDIQGSDYLSSRYVPPYEEEKWRRTCTACKLVEETREVILVTKNIGNGLQSQVEEPKFMED